MKKLLMVSITLMVTIFIQFGYFDYTAASNAADKSIVLNLATVAPPVGSTGEELKWIYRLR